MKATWCFDATFEQLAMTMLGLLDKAVRVSFGSVYSSHAGESLPKGLCLARQNTVLVYSFR